MGECDSNRDGHWRPTVTVNEATLLDSSDLLGRSCQELRSSIFELAGFTERALSHSRTDPRLEVDIERATAVIRGEWSAVPELVDQ